MTFTFAAAVAWDPIGKQAVKNTSFQVYAQADTGFVTPLAITDTFGATLPGNILNSGSQGVFPEFEQATNSTVVITDPSHTYVWTVTAIMQDTSVAAFMDAPGSATSQAVRTKVAEEFADPESETHAVLNATYGPSAAPMKAAFATAPSGAATAQPVLGKIKRNVEDVSILNMSDSTGVYSASEPRWAYKFCQRLAADWPTHTVIFHPWDTTGNVWGTDMTVSTGTGARTIHFWNAAFTGTRLEQFMGEYWSTVVVNNQPDLVFMNYGLNDGSTDVNGATYYARNRAHTFTESITESVPGAAVIILTQNERIDVSNSVTAIRASAYAKAAQQTGHGLIDVRQAFIDDSRGLAALLNGDNLHPNNAGSDLIADTIYASFKYNPSITPRTAQPSSFTQPAKNLLTNGDFADPIAGGLLPGWTKVTSNVAANTSVFERPKGYSVQVTAVGSTNQAYIYQDVDMAGLLGKWVTLAARVYIPAGQNNTAGRVAIDCGLGAANDRTSSGINTARNGWQWFVLSKYIDPTATRIRVKLYADTALTASADARFDRVSLVVGQVPREGLTIVTPVTPAPPGLVPVTDMLSTLGAGAPAGNYTGSDQTLQGVGIGSAVEIVPHRNFTLRYLDWRSGTVVGGNYDIGILDASGTALWKKGGTAYPAASTDVTEDLSATPLALTAGTKYYVIFTGDSSTSTIRGINAPSAIFNRKADGNYRCRGVSGSYPLGTSHVLGAGGVRTPMIMLREA